MRRDDFGAGELRDLLNYVLEARFPLSYNLVVDYYY